MPRKSATENVAKICSCVQWKACAHPWYVDLQGRGNHPRRPNERYRRISIWPAARGDVLREAQDEARRAITAWLDGRDPSACNRAIGRRSRSARGYRRRPEASPRPTSGEAHHAAEGAGAAVRRVAMSDITREALDAFRGSGPVAGNRNLAFLRACSTGRLRWACRSPFKVGTSRS